ncbi:variant-specific surface protein VSP4A1-like [Mytilus trossulus]|uniref:variant-specific surface protein VSP4A1-like n=1 Tax=Mytilus trossulus TaxID=6551 RepID=UPI003004DAF2
MSTRFSAQYIGICMVFAVYIAVSVEGVAFGGNCSGSGTGDCTEKNNTVCNGTCKCATNSFRKSTSECAKKIALNQTCTTGQSAGQCADSNAACVGTALKCQCKSTHFVSKTGACKLVVTALDAACDASDSFSHQCAVVNSECRKDGTDKCLCKATHYAKGATCEIRKKPDEGGCAAHECVTHATCNTKSNPTKCQCDTGYTAIPTTTPTMCSGVPKVATLSYMFVIPILLSMVFLLR